MSRLGKRAVALVSSKWPLSIAASMQPLVENPPRECASFAGFQSKLQMRGKCCLETLAARILAKAFLRAGFRPTGLFAGAKAGPNPTAVPLEQADDLPARRRGLAPAGRARRHGRAEERVQRQRNRRPVYEWLMPGFGLDLGSYAMPARPQAGGPPGQCPFLLRFLADWAGGRVASQEEGLAADPVCKSGADHMTCCREARDRREYDCSERYSRRGQARS